MCGHGPTLARKYTFIASAYTHFHAYLYARVNLHVVNRLSCTRLLRARVFSRCLLSGITMRNTINECKPILTCAPTHILSYYEFTPFI